MREGGRGREREAGKGGRGRRRSWMRGALRAGAVGLCVGRKTGRD
jgi:hypothetical protein